MFEGDIAYAEDRTYDDADSQERFYSGNFAEMFSLSRRTRVQEGNPWLATW